MGTGPIAVAFGTRPELIKLSGIVRELGPRAHTIHTGQHFDPGMSNVFLDELGLGPPAVQLHVGGRSRGQQIGAATERLDELFAELQPAAVVVQGDTNATVAGALAANARGIPLVHVEAGLRSHDRHMPEEHNRVVADHLADLCLAPTAVSRDNLRSEGIPDERIVVTGNTVVDAVKTLLPDASARTWALDHAGVDAGRFVLATLHRPENVDDADRLSMLLDGLAVLDLPVLFPVHPRTSARMEAFGLRDRLAAVRAVGPLRYPTFLALLAECGVAVSDSGGVVEEASVVKRPVLVVRRSTERPEVLGTFATLTDPDRFAAQAAEMLEDLASEHRRLADLPSPYGDGDASQRSIAALTEVLGP